MILLFSACAKPDFNKAGVEINAESSKSVVNLSNIMIFSPEKRLSEYIESGHLRLLAYYSMEGLNVPGFKGKQAANVVEKFGIEIAPAMGDQVFNENHRKLQAYFIDYADRYNVMLVDYTLTSKSNE
jgi:hypothetical protein